MGPRVSSILSAKWPLALALVTSACAGSTGTTSEVPATALPAIVEPISNEGGSREGHTPRGFAGSGTGLFVGDNLNSGFPDDDGVQLWLSFALPADGAPPALAVLSSDVMTSVGNPFDDLGALQAEPVTYDTFGPQLFDLAPDGPAVDCRSIGAQRLECDVTDAVTAALVSGSQSAQFRLRFERVADADGNQDLAFFFLTDSNTNEPGIFHLELS
jgi:hypothetical protein